MPYIGLSQGSAMMLYALAKDSDWFKDHVSVFIAIGPVAKFGENGNPNLMWISKNEWIFHWMQKLGSEEVKPNSNWLQSFYACLLKLIPGYSEYYIANTSDNRGDLSDINGLQKLWYFFPFGSNLTNFLQWGACVRNQYLAERHYGEVENIKRYGQKEPPKVDLTKIHSVPIAMFCGKYDKFSPVEDSEWVKSQINPAFYKMYESHGHISFLIGKDMSYLDDVQKLLKEYSSK